LSEPTIRVKQITRSSRTDCRWSRQCPNGAPRWGRCEFLSDPLERDYDWLVVTNDVTHELPGNTEILACPKEHTILITTEPSNITRYGADFADQFEYLITNQDEVSLPHRNAWRTQPGSRWFYEKTYDQVISEAPWQKTKLVSAIATDKKQRHTLHRARYDFTTKLMEKIPEVDLLYSFERKRAAFQQLFDGKAIFVDRKVDMIDPYKYHLAVGNQAGPNILTERVTDSFLGYAVPITYGCTNLSEYFPVESYIEIDLLNPDDAIEKIRNIIYDPDDYSRRIESIKEARRRVIEEYNLPMMLSKVIESAPPVKHAAVGEKLYGRRVMRWRHPQEFVRFALWRTRNALAPGH